jgi:hypothetical protein
MGYGSDEFVGDDSVCARNMGDLGEKLPDRQGRAERGEAKRWHRPGDGALKVAAGSEGTRAGLALHCRLGRCGRSGPQ